MQPNVVYVLADDLGYGDIACLNPEGRIKTPHVDALARDGMVFTDAHSSSAVCSPSRYSILTGRYNWRSSLQRGIVREYGDPLIAADRLTVPALLREHGYATACIGKWHLGQGWDFDADQPDFYPSSKTAVGAASEEQQAKWREVFAKPTTGGPTTRGFDSYFGVDVPNWPPYCFIENDRTVGIPSEFLPEHLVGNNLASCSGPAMPGWNFEQLLPTWAEKSEAFIAEQSAAQTPFFLFLTLTSPHTPLSVNEAWRGQSGLNNAYADLVMETDAVLGQVMAALEAHGVADNTLVIFTSDNGCAHYIGTDMLEAQGHYPSGPYRGYKSDAWDGGHRVPCIARWPKGIPAGTSCDALVCLSDLMATCADILDLSLPDDAGEDSVSMLPLFQGEAGARQTAVHHAIHGKFAIRDGRWKLVCCPGSGGWSHNDAVAAEAGLPLVQLYDMEADPGERINRFADEPEVVRRLVATLEQIIADGRSTPGAKQINDVAVDVWKLETMPGVDASFLDDY